MLRLTQVVRLAASVFFFALGLFGQSVDLSVLNFGYAPSDTLEPGESFHYSFGVSGYSGFPGVSARNVILQIELTRGLTFASLNMDYPGWQCSEDTNTVTCSAASFVDYAAIDIQVIAPSSLEGGALTARASIRSDSPDPDSSNNSATETRRVFRQYEVISSADSGTGSLRDVVERTNAECDRDGVPCRVVFHVPAPVPEPGWFTIDLRSPLPQIASTVLILDATSQTAFTGDTNPGGPEVLLSGVLLEQGNGLVVGRPAERITDIYRRVDVSGLVINGFPENGILFPDTGDSTYTNFFSVTNSYIGTDPWGIVAVPNRLRGIAVFEHGFMTISSNVISGNGRSGVLVDSHGPSIENNRIGVQARTDEPLPNGASGVYFGTSSGSGCVFRNVIASNHHFGVAVERHATDISVTQNSIKTNGIFGFDIGMDLSTVGGTDKVIIRPTITSARYDAATGRTTVRGTFTPQSLFAVDMIDLYSNSSLEAKGQGEVWLGAVQSETTEFVLEYQGNLLGKAVTATDTRTIYNGFLRSPTPEASMPLKPTAKADFPPPYSCQTQGFEQQTSEFSDPVVVTE